MAQKNKDILVGETKAQMDRYQEQILTLVKDHINMLDVKVTNDMGEIREELKNITKQILRNANTPLHITKGKGKSRHQRKRENGGIPQK